MLLLVGILSVIVWVLGLLAYPQAGWYQHVPLVFAVAAFAARLMGKRPRVRPPRSGPRTASP